MENTSNELGIVTYEDLIVFMDTIEKRTVSNWNEQRENAKSLFPMGLIYQLDSSGHIRQWLNK